MSSSFTVFQCWGVLHHFRCLKLCKDTFQVKSNSVVPFFLLSVLYLDEKEKRNTSLCNIPLCINLLWKRNVDLDTKTTPPKQCVSIILKYLSILVQQHSRLTWREYFSETTEGRYYLASCSCLGNCELHRVFLLKKPSAYSAEILFGAWCQAKAATWTRLSRQHVTHQASQLNMMCYSCGTRVLKGFIYFIEHDCKIW